MKNWGNLPRPVADVMFSCFYKGEKPANFMVETAIKAGYWILMTALQVATLFYINWMTCTSVGYNSKQFYESGYNNLCHSHHSVPAKSTDSVYLYLLNAKYSLINSLISKFSLDSVGLGSDCKFYKTTFLRIKYWWLKTVTNKLLNSLETLSFMAHGLILESVQCV